MSVTEYRNQRRGNKYCAAAVVEDGMRFDSKLEAARYRYWKNLWHAGAIEWFTRQVPFQLPGGIVWRADFLVHGKPGELLRIEDCKGVMTRVALNKIKQVEAIYGIEVHIITKKDMRR